MIYLLRYVCVDILSQVQRYIKDTWKKRLLVINRNRLNSRCAFNSITNDSNRVLLVLLFRKWYCPTSCRKWNIYDPVPLFKLVAWPLFVVIRSERLNRSLRDFKCCEWRIVGRNCESTSDGLDRSSLINRHADRFDRRITPTPKNIGPC